MRKYSNWIGRPDDMVLGYLCTSLTLSCRVDLFQFFSLGLIVPSGPSVILCCGSVKRSVESCMISVGYLVGVNLTVADEMHSHLEPLWEINPLLLHKQVGKQTTDRYVIA